MGEYFSNLLNLPGPHRALLRVSSVIMLTYGGYNLLQIFMPTRLDSDNIANLIFTGALSLGIAFSLIALLAAEVYFWRKNQAKNAQGDKEQAHHTRLLAQEKPVAYIVIGFFIVCAHLCFYPAQLSYNFNACVQEKLAYQTHAESSDNASLYVPNTERNQDAIMRGCLREVRVPDVLTPPIASLRF